MNILITGTSSGIGKQLALDYLKDSQDTHTVYCCGRNRDALQELAAEFPDKAIILEFDIQSYEECKESLSAQQDLDLVILNAGTCEYIDANHFDARSFKRVFDINVVGMANCLEFLIPRMRKNSTLALMGSSSSFLPLPRAEAYGASKAATEYLAKTMAITLHAKAIHVSYIAPGFVATPLTERNDFPMPMQITAEQAALAIRKGITRKRRVIHFPKLFTWLLLFLRSLPLFVQLKLIRKTLLKH